MVHPHALSQQLEAGCELLLPCLINLQAHHRSRSTGVAVLPLSSPRPDLSAQRTGQSAGKAEHLDDEQRLAAEQLLQGL